MNALPTFSRACAALLHIAGLLAVFRDSQASQVLMPLNTNKSLLTLTLCTDAGLGRKCSTDKSPLGGFLLVAFDDNRKPSALSIRNFDIRTMRNMHLTNNYNFLGKLVVTTTNLRLFHADVGPKNPFQTISNGQFAATNVPSQAEGMANYQATSLLCTFMTSSGMPCTGSFDLSQQGPVAIEIPGQISVSNGVAYIHADFSVFSYLDPTNTTLGDMTMVASLDASAPLPPALVPFGSDWRHLDDGKEPPSNWVQTGFDDASWPLGVAGFGFGRGNETTTNQFGSDPLHKHLSYYFRHLFQVSSPASFTNLALKLLRDDGAAVYLNGREVFRNNLPSGALHSSTLATNAITGSFGTNWVTVSVSPAWLRNGPNLLAVEVHLFAPNDPDMAFDLELSSLAEGAPFLMAAGQTGGNRSVRWPSWAAGYRLYQAAAPASDAAWDIVPDPVTDDGTWKIVVLPAASANSFFRLKP